MPSLKIFSFNPLQVNTYLIYNQNSAGILIDPACLDEREFTQLSDFILLNKIRLDYQLNTHGHFDHLFGVSRVKAFFHPRFLLHRADEVFLHHAGNQARSFGLDYDSNMPVPDGYLSESEMVTADSISLKVIHVPGHSQGSVAFYEPSAGWLFSGDTLFAGGIGRTDLPGGNYAQIMASIREKLLVLPGTTQVYPGHGPSSRIETERLTNPFL